MAELQRNFHILKGGYIGDPNINTAGAGPSSGQCRACPKAGTCPKLIEALAKGEHNMMMNESPGTLLPPGVGDEEEINTAARASQAGAHELTVNEKILADWEGYEGLMPPEIVALSVSQRSQSHDDEGLYPRGVE